MTALRILDTGLNPARLNAGIMAALAELHRTGRAVDTLRFYRAPHAVLLGRHQNQRRAVNLAFCRRKEIEIARRVTGGVALQVGPDVLGFDLVAERRDFGPSLGNAIAWVSTGLAAGIARMGLPARFEPSGHVAIEGRIVARVTATFDGFTLIFQGFIHLDAANRRMKDALVAGGRVATSGAAFGTTSLATLLGRTPRSEEVIGYVVAGLCDTLRRTPEPGEVTDEERQLAGRFAADAAEDAGPGETTQAETRVVRQRAGSGYLEALVSLVPGKTRQIERIRIVGDFSVAPTNAIDELEAALRGVPADSAAEQARAMLEQSAVMLSGVAPVDIAAAIAAAVRPKPPRRSL